MVRTNLIRYLFSGSRINVTQFFSIRHAALFTDIYLHQSTASSLAYSDVYYTTVSYIDIAIFRSLSQRFRIEFKNWCLHAAAVNSSHTSQRVSAQLLFLSINNERRLYALLSAHSTGQLIACTGRCNIVTRGVLPCPSYSRQVLRLTTCSTTCLTIEADETVARTAGIIFPWTGAFVIPGRWSTVEDCCKDVPRLKRVNIVYCQMSGQVLSRTVYCDQLQSETVIKR